jgi:hypothetical protein
MDDVITSQSCLGYLLLLNRLLYFAVSTHLRRSAGVDGPEYKCAVSAMGKTAIHNTL